MIELTGHFHPLLVHLPIGILLVALALQRLSQIEKYQLYKPVVPVIFLWGSVSAIIACITGYLLSVSDKYNKSLVNWHMWTAIGLVIGSAILYTKEKNPKVEVPKKLLSFVLLALVVTTSHLGASLTHGSDYLTKPLIKKFKNGSISQTAAKAYYSTKQEIGENKKNLKRELEVLP